MPQPERNENTLSYTRAPSERVSRSPFWPSRARQLRTVTRVESLTLDRMTLHFKQKLALDYAELVYNGLWFTPMREALDAFFAVTCQNTTGEVTLSMYKGSVQPASRKSPHSLYSLSIGSFTMGEDYDQTDAFGFINLTGLPMKIRAALIRGQATKPPNSPEV